MPSIGELLLILLIVLVVFGASRLPQLGDALGRTVRAVVRPGASAASSDDAADDEDVAEASEPEERSEDGPVSG